MSYNQKAYALGSKRSIIREIFEYSKTRAQEIGAENVFDFSLGNPSVEPPKMVTDTIKELLEKENSTTLHGYTSAQGDLGVRKAIAENLNKRFNVGLTPNNIYMTCGAAASLSICLKAVINEGDKCIVFAPFFTEYRVFVENAGGKLIISKPEGKTFQIDIADLESKINENTKALILNSPNNPSGVVYTEDTIKAVCDLLKRKENEYKHEIYLLADEPYRELVYNNVKVPYLMNYYDNTLVCYSFSKSLSLPGERIGYIAVNPKMSDSNNVYLAVCGAGRSLGYVCAPSLFQKVVAKCLDAQVNLNAYEQNRNLLYNSLTDFGFECVKPDGAFYLFVKSPLESATAFYEKAKSHEILVVPCDDFGVEGYVRIAYCVDYNRIKNSLEGFKKLAKECKLI
ncbi:MAG: pyridoxal phosphate-dependent aminotransferase [Clostridiales bacterium]|nr:pyridoxal phosphate-dependent aminotransferase [Clostridiales bacterium]